MASRTISASAAEPSSPEDMQPLWCMHVRLLRGIFQGMHGNVRSGSQPCPLLQPQASTTCAWA